MRFISGSSVGTLHTSYMRQLFNGVQQAKKNLPPIAHSNVCHMRPHIPNKGSPLCGRDSCYGVKASGEVVA